MKKTILIFLFILFTGCGSNINEIFHKDEQYIKITQYTQRGQIINSLETVALINVTYMNPFINEKNETKNNEIFIIGVYNSNDYNGYEKGGIFNNHYTLTMNNLNFTKATKADIEKLNLKTYPFYNKWMKYYKVYFPKTDDSKLSVKYSNNSKGEVILSIPKKIEE